MDEPTSESQNDEPSLTTRAVSDCAHTEPIFVEEVLSTSELAPKPACANEPEESKVVSRPSVENVTIIQYEQRSCTHKLPILTDDDPSPEQILSRPICFLGSLTFVVSLIIIALLLIALPHTGLAVIAVAARYCLVPALALIVGLMLLSLYQQNGAFLEFFAGMLVPVTRMLGFAREAPYCAMAEVMEHRNNYAAAASANAKALQIVGSFEAIKQFRFFEREYMLDLAHAGQYDRARAYAQETMQYARYLHEQCKTNLSAEYHAHTLRSAALLYDVIGDTDQARAIQEEVYVAHKDAPTSSHQYLLSQLCAGELNFRDGHYQAAVEHMDAFLAHFQTCQFIAVSPNYATAAYLCLAVSHAHLGNFEKSMEYLGLGRKKNRGSLSSYSRVAEAVAESEVELLKGNTEQAQLSLAQCERKVRLVSGTPMYRQIHAQMERVSIGTLGIQEKTVDDRTPAQVMSRLAQVADKRITPPLISVTKEMSIPGHRLFVRDQQRRAFLALVMMGVISFKGMHGELNCAAVFIVALVISHFYFSAREQARNKIEAQLLEECERIPVQVRVHSNSVFATSHGEPGKQWISDGIFNCADLAMLVGNEPIAGELIRNTNRDDVCYLSVVGFYVKAKALLV